MRKLDKTPPESAGPDRPIRVNPTPPNYQHDFNKQEICKRCGSLGNTRGNLCTGKKL